MKKLSLVLACVLLVGGIFAQDKTTTTKTDKKSTTTTTKTDKKTTTKKAPAKKAAAKTDKPAAK